jgi:hypothetical protein
MIDLIEEKSIEHFNFERMQNVHLLLITQSKFSFVYKYLGSNPLDFGLTDFVAASVTEKRGF